MSGFSTFNTATSGLSAAQRAMDATSQNIVNANTPGYSRQRVTLASIGPTTAASLHSGQGGVFGGVRVTDVARIRDAFLEATRAAAGGRQAAITAQTDILSGAELLFSEPGDTGVQKSLDSFYNAWHDLGASPTDPSAGSVVIERGIHFAQQLKAVSTSVSAQWTTARNNLVDVAERTNQAAKDLAQLNVAIRAGQSSGKPVNELLDTRDLMVRQLASLIGGYATTDDDGQVSVSINGVSIVSGTNSFPVTVTGAFNLTNSTANPPGLKVGAFNVPVETGAAAGLLATLRTDLPSISVKVDKVATGVMTAVNSLYSTGFTPAGATGNPFFTGTDAQTMAVVPTQGGSLAIAAAAGITDGTIGRKIGDLADDVKIAAVLGGPGPSVQWRDLTTSVGVQLQSLKTAQSVQDAVASAAEDSVQSDAGVNLDEEMTNMMLFQRAYQSSARVITTADEMLDTLINRTGRVGL